MGAAHDSYRSLVDSMPDGYARHRVILDDRGEPVDYVFLDVNPAFERLTGLEREQIIGRRATEVLPGTEHSEFDWIGTYGQVAATGQTVTFERYSEPLGRWYDVVAYRDVRGQFVTVFHDVTARKVAEQALHESKEKYRSLFEQSVDAIVLVAPDGTGIEANQAWLDLFGYTREELPHVNARDIYADPPDRGDFLRRIAETGFVKDIVRFKRKDGTVFDCQRSVVALKDDEGVTTAFLNVKRDISEELRRERTLHESEERFRSLFEQSLDAILIDSPDGRTLESNWAWADMLGYTMDEVRPLRATDVYVDPSERGEFLARIERDGSVSDMVRLKKKDGTVIDCERSAVARRKGDGAIVAIQGVYKDITERKRAEERLQQSFAQLERALQGTLHVIERIVETRDPFTAGHQKRVAELAVAIARHMGLPEDSCVSLIRTSALIHDIGKIAVPAEILSKPGTLSDDEFSLIKAHPRVAYDILKQAELEYPVPEIVLQHHERCDGTGYPSALRGDDILPEASILAVADVVEAMCSHRPYREALGIDPALGEIRDGRGTRYYPDVVDACIAVFTEGGFSFSG